MIAIGDLKTWLKAEDIGAEEESALRDLERRAVAFLEGETARYLRAKAETTDVIEGKGGRSLWLADPPTDEIAEVEERADPGDDPVTIAADDDDGFEVRGAELVRKGGHVWTRGSEYTVTYERGFEKAGDDEDVLADAPEVARAAVFDLVALKWSGRGKEGMRSEAIGGYTYRRSDLDEVPGLDEAIAQLRLDWL